MKKNRLISPAIVLLLSFSGHAQNEPLTAWSSAGEVELSESFQDDPDIQTLLTIDKILVAGPALHTAGCGSVAVNELQSDGSIMELQRLQADDFGTGCTGTDGFGYAMDSADNVLVIGAPGQINIAQGSATELAAGAVYIYRFDETGNEFVPVDDLQGENQVGNQAWGTRVATDGQNILVQSNEPVLIATAQGNANPRSVNLITNSSSGWQFAQSFTDNASDMFGQDFGISGGQIIINQHQYIEQQVCVPGFEAEQFNTAMTVYQNNGDRFVASNSFEFMNMTRSLEVAPTLDQIIVHDVQGEVVFDVYTGYFDCSTTSVGHGDLLRQFLFNAENELIATGSFNIKMPTSLFGPFSDNIGIPNNNTFAIEGRNILVFDITDFNKPVIETFQPTTIQTPNGTNVPSSQLIQREVLSLEMFDVFNSEPIRNTSLNINTRVELLSLTTVHTGEPNEVNIYTSIPALDPAITQTWWFGPAFSGQGVTFEVISDNRLIMYWLTYDFNGNQMWLRGVGQLQDGEVEVTLIRPSGPQFDQTLFDPADRIREVWGTATVQFDGCNAGTLRYDSDEFGTGEMPLMTFIDLGRECGTGIITSNTEDNPFRVELRNVGSFYDPARDGEGLLLMPWPDNCRPDVFADSHACRLAYLLSYDAQGEQSWLGLGVLVDDSQENSFVPDCFEDPDFGIVRGCETILESLGTDRPGGQPRRPMGGIFGSDFDPAQVVRMPWGEHTQIFELLGDSSGRQFIEFSTPDGEASLRFLQLTTPVGYEN